MWSCTPDQNNTCMDNFFKFLFIFVFNLWRVYLENCCTLGLKWTAHTQSASVKMLQSLVAQHSINIEAAGIKTESAWGFGHINKRI